MIVEFFVQPLPTSSRGSVCFFDSFVATEVNKFTLKTNICHPLSVELVVANTFIARSVITIASCVVHILANSCFAKIAQAVIHPVAVYVVDNVFRPAAIVQIPREAVRVVSVRAYLDVEVVVAFMVVSCF